MVVVTRAGRLREWSQGELRLYKNTIMSLQYRSLQVEYSKHARAHCINKQEQIMKTKDKIKEEKYKNKIRKRN